MEPEHPSERAETFAREGWVLLEQRKYEAALEKFREALWLDPDCEPARLGTVEAMKGRHRIYGLFLRYCLWMSRLPIVAAWLIVLGAWYGARQAHLVADQHPESAVWILPALAHNRFFALMTWIARPLYNLILRLDRFGKLLLSRDEIVASNWVLAFVVGALGMVGVALATGESAPLTGAAILTMLVAPVAVTYELPAGARRLVMGFATLVVCAFWMTWMACSFLRIDLSIPEPLVDAMIWALVFSPLFGVALGQARSR
jgi:hypothetical protein